MISYVGYLTRKTVRKIRDYVDGTLDIVKEPARLVGFRRQMANNEDGQTSSKRAVLTRRGTEVQDTRKARNSYVTHRATDCDSMSSPLDSDGENENENEEDASYRVTYVARDSRPRRLRNVRFSVAPDDESTASYREVDPADPFVLNIRIASRSS